SHTGPPGRPPADLDRGRIRAKFMPFDPGTNQDNETDPPSRLAQLPPPPPGGSPRGPRARGPRAGEAGDRGRARRDPGVARGPPARGRLRGDRDLRARRRRLRRRPRRGPREERRRASPGAPPARAPRVRRGEVYLAALEPRSGSERRGR